MIQVVEFDSLEKEAVMLHSVVLNLFAPLWAHWVT